MDSHPKIKDTYRRIKLLYRKKFSSAKTISQLLIFMYHGLEDQKIFALKPYVYFGREELKVDLSGCFTGDVFYIYFFALPLAH